MAEAALVVENIHKSFGDIEVLKGISVTAGDGDVISMLGSSGSGKSTFLRCINLLEVPNSGTVTVKGESVLWPVLREAYWCALLAFMLNTAAYTTEIFRGGIEAVPFGEVGAAKAAGMSPLTRVRRIILPGALRRALPAYSNEVIFMLHGSAIASVITIIDILGAGRELNGKHYLAFEGFITAGVLYFLLTFAIVGLFKQWEKAWFAHLKPRED